MGKNSYETRAAAREPKQKIHPVWRGVGFLFAVLIPFLSYLAAQLVLELNTQARWFPIARDLFAKRGDFLFDLFRDPMIHVKLLIALAIAFVLYMIFLLVASLINSMFGVSRYGAYDMPPVELPKGVRKVKAR